MKHIASKLQFPEGPIAMEDGSVILVELARETLTRVFKDGRTEIIAQIGGGPNGAALGPNGHVYVCNNGGFDWTRRDVRPRASGKLAPGYTSGRIEVVNLNTGKVERLYDRCGEHMLRAPNDLVFDTDGNFWFTDSGKGQPRMMDKGGIYWAKADGSEIREVAYGLFSPNGIGLSPDGKTLYAVETPTARLWSWDIVGPGQLHKRRGLVPHGGFFVWGSALYQKFDSLAVTASGRICVATLSNGGITEIAGDGGWGRHHPMPDMDVTNIAFGGKDMKTAYVTWADSGELISTDWHEPGLKLAFQQ